MLIQFAGFGGERASSRGGDRRKRGMRGKRGNEPLGRKMLGRPSQSEATAAVIEDPVGVKRKLMGRQAGQSGGERL